MQEMWLREAGDDIMSEITGLAGAELGHRAVNQAITQMTR